MPRASVHESAGEQRLDLGGEQQQVPGASVIQRLDAQPVSRQQQPLALRIPQAEGEHPVQLAQQLGGVAAGLLVAMDEHLRVGVGAEAVALRQQWLAQAEVVVQLAVVREPDRAVLVAERLPALFREVDDGEPAVRQRAGAFAPPPGVVWPPMCHRCGHALHGLGRRTGAVERDDADDPTHRGGVLP